MLGLFKLETVTRPAKLARKKQAVIPTNVPNIIVNNKKNITKNISTS